MTSITDTSTAVSAPKSRIDFTKPVLWLFAIVLIALILLPLSWLAVYSLTDKARHFTLQNFVTLFSDPDFLDPLLTTAIIAVTSAAICCVIAAPIGWLVSRSDMPGRQTIRALVTASFVTPPFLGAVAWELLAAPNSGLLNQFYRTVTGAESDDHLFNIYSLPGLIFVISCYTFPFVFVLVANALDTMPGELEDASAILGGKAWTTARRVTIPLALPALVAGSLIAFLQAMTLFGSPAILALPAGVHTMTTKSWSLFQYPPKLELAAAAAVPLLVLTILLLQAQKFILGRRGYSVVGGKYAAPRRAERLALGRARLLPDRATEPGVPALSRAAQCRLLAERDDARDAFDIDPAQHRLRIHRIVRNRARAQEHGDPGHRDRDHRHDPRARHRLCHDAPGDRGLARARLSRHRAGRRSRHRARCRVVPKLYAAAFRAVRHAVDSADRLSHHQPAVGLSAITGGVCDHPSRARGGEPHSRRHTAAIAAPDHRAAVAHRRHRDLLLHLHRRDARIVGGDRAVHLADQGAVGPDFRSQRKRRSRRDFGVGHRHAGDHLRGGAGRQPHPDVRSQCRRAPAQCIASARTG